MNHDSETRETQRTCDHHSVYGHECDVVIGRTGNGESEQTVTGCLQRGVEPVGFFIIGAGDKNWELYSGKEVSLADHVGHTVTVTGSVAKRSAKQEEKSQPNEKKETGAREHSDLQVSSLTMVSETCSK